VQQKEDKEKKHELKPLPKEDALESIRKFKRDFGLIGIPTSKKRIRDILRRSGSLSDGVTQSRREQDI
jgi:hypothetical protein